MNGRGSRHSAIFYHVVPRYTIYCGMSRINTKFIVVDFNAEGYLLLQVTDKDRRFDCVAAARQR